MRFTFLLQYAPFNILSLSKQSFYFNTVYIFGGIITFLYTFQKLHVSFFNITSRNKFSEKSATLILKGAQQKF